MRTTLRNLLIAIPALILFAFSLALHAQNMTISGNVVGEDGKPLQNAQIVIDRTDIKGQYKVKTDRRGNYVYAGLPYTGTFNVTLEIGGKPVDQIRGIRSRGGAPVEGVNFDLAKIKAGQTAAQAQVERGMSDEEKAALEKARKEQEAALAKNQELNNAFNAGKEAANAKNWPAAIDAFVKASVLDPLQHVVWGNLADAYLARNEGDDLEKGIAAYAKAVELKADDPAYHNNYALALGRAKKFTEAEAELAKAAQIDPPSAGKYFYNLGALYVNSGANQPAGAAFRKAVEADPNYADAYYQLGLVMFAEATLSADGKIVPPAGTAENFQKYLQLRPTGANADAAKAMLEAMGSTVETSFSNKKQPAPKKK
jgi:tetratricopeptide (TPR) repeat protein